MKRLNLPLITDTLFAAVCAFLLFFTAMRFYTKNAFVGLAFGIGAGLLAGALAFLYIGAKQNKSLLLSRNEKDKKLLSLHLSLSRDGYITDLFSKCLKEAETDGKRVISGGVTYFFNFKMQPLSEDDIAAVIKYETDGEKAIYCVSVLPLPAAMLAESFNIGITGINEVYSALKENNLLPEKYVYEEPKKSGIFKRIKSRFSRKLCAPLFWSGLALLALSYFTFFPIYYIVSGGIMLFIAAIALVVN